MKAAGMTVVWIGLFVGQLGAQSIDPPPFAQDYPYTYVSGSFYNDTDQRALMHTHVVHVVGVPSLRAFFAEVDLGEADTLVVTSLLDGNRHELNRHELAKWQYSSGYFNGDALLFELYVEPGSRGSYEIDRVSIGIPGHVTPGSYQTICGPLDDRVPSFDNRAMRMLNSSGTSACSGWLTGPDDCVLSAGHCFPTFASVAEVNVPLSNANGSLNHPPIEDQFPLDADTLVFTAGGLGSDWALGNLFTNNLGQSAAALWGHFDLGFFAPLPGETTRITGYGSDGGTSDQIQQTHTGPYEVTQETSIRYMVDTTGGSSGSVVIHEPTGLAIGIHTNGGCTSSGGSNSGTSLLNASLLDAWIENCFQVPSVPAASFSASPTNIAPLGTVHFFDQSTGFPSEWSWDFDEDGVEDSNERSPSFSYVEAGVYDVTLTVGNTEGMDTVTLVDLITVMPVSAVALPYTQEFATLPAEGWAFESSSEFGAIAIGGSGTSSPGSGDPALTMSSSVSGEFVINESKLLFALPANYDLRLSYWFKETSDENDPEDGLFLSNGMIEIELVSHQDGSQNWVQFQVDVGSAALTAGFAPGEELYLIFRQADNFVLGIDGHLIDDIELTTTPALVLDFETEDDFATPLFNGQIIEAGAAFGRLVQIDGLSFSGHAPCIFDSDPAGPNAASVDQDLLVDRGNLLIVNKTGVETNPGFYDVPNDDPFGGVFEFTFPHEARLSSIDLIDICPDPASGALVTLFDATGKSRTTTVPSGWTEDLLNHGPPGYRTLNLLTTADQPGFASTATTTVMAGFDVNRVVSMQVVFTISGALDNLNMAPPSRSARGRRKL